MAVSIHITPSYFEANAGKFKSTHYVLHQVSTGQQMTLPKGETLNAANGQVTPVSPGNLLLKVF